MYRLSDTQYVLREIGTGEEVQRYLLPPRVRAQHSPCEQQKRALHEGQATEYGRTSLWYAHPVFGHGKSEYLGARAGQ